MKGIITAGLLLATCGSAYTAEAKDKKVWTSLELQQLQSREIEAGKEQVFGAVMSVLQDSGYRIQAADKDTGLITGVASTKSKMSWKPFVGFGRSKKSPIVSAFIEPRGATMTRVRLSFVMGKVNSTMYGTGAQDEEPIYDQSVYQTAFEQINQTVFIRANMDSPAATAASSAAPVAAPVATPVSVSATATKPK